MPFSLDALDGTTTVVRVGSRLDFENADHFKSLARDLVGSGTRRVILDFSRTDVLDSTGLGAVFSLYRRLNTLGGRMVLVNPTSQVETMLKLTRTDRVFDRYPSVEEATDSIRESGRA